jgi:outer membrane protein OmpU
MKKLLLTTTALTLSAGVAAADVSLSGDARMGIVYNSNAGVGTNLTSPSGATDTENKSNMQLTSRVRVTFTLSGETDGGLAFGGSFRADNASDAAAGNAGSVFISGEFGRLSMGDVAGAARATVGDLHGVGLTGLGDFNEITYLDRVYSAGAGTALNRRSSALYTYSIDAFTINVSVGQLREIAVQNAIVDPALPTTNATKPAKTNSVKDTLFGVGVSYAIDDLKLSLGYESQRVERSLFATAANNTNWNADHLILGAEYTIEGIALKAVYGRVGGDLGTALANQTNRDRAHFGLSASGTFDATTVSAFAHRTINKTTNFGIGASYDLGGGASIVGGVTVEGARKTSTQKTGVTNSTAVTAASGAINENAALRTTRADIGLSFSF